MLKYMGNTRKNYKSWTINSPEDVTKVKPN
jgi:hypothetical protein